MIWLSSRIFACPSSLCLYCFLFSFISPFSSTYFCLYPLTAKRYRSLGQFCCEPCYRLCIQAWEDDIHQARHTSWESTDTMNRPMNSSTNRCLAQGQTSDSALSCDPFAIAQCVLPSCIDNIGLKPEVEKELTEFACTGRLPHSLEALHLLQLYYAHLRGARLYAISYTRPSRRLSAVGSAYQRV